MTVGILRSAPRAEAWRTGVAARRDWPDGSHDLVHFCLTADEACRFIKADREYWHRGPAWPEYSVVQVSARDFDLHQKRRLCRAPDCPVATQTAVSVLPGAGAVH